jgi:hypothetical protein
MVRWHHDKKKGTVENFFITHKIPPCGELKKSYLNKSLEMDFVFKNMPEFLAYVTRFEYDKKELKNFVHKIEKDRSYIRRFNADKKIIKKMIILLDGFGE